MCNRRFYYLFSVHCSRCNCQLNVGGINWKPQLIVLCVCVYLLDVTRMAPTFSIIAHGRRTNKLYCMNNVQIFGQRHQTIQFDRIHNICSESWGIPAKNCSLSWLLEPNEESEGKKQLLMIQSVFNFSLSNKINE